MDLDCVVWVCRVVTVAITECVVWVCLIGKVYSTFKYWEVHITKCVVWVYRV